MAAKISDILTPEERFSRSIPYDEAVIRVWDLFVHHMVSSCIIRKNNKLYVTKKNALDDANATCLPMAGFARVLNNRYPHVEHLIDMGVLVHSSENSYMYQVKSSIYDHMLRRIRAELSEEKKRTKSKKGAIQSVYRKMMSEQPCPEWFKPTFATNAPISTKPDEPNLSNVKAIIKWISELNKYLNVDFLEEQSKWIKENTQKIRDIHHQRSRESMIKFRLKNGCFYDTGIRAEYHNQYYLENKQHLLEYNRKYQQENDEYRVSVHENKLAYFYRSKGIEPHEARQIARIGAIQYAKERGLKYSRSPTVTESEKEYSEKLKQKSRRLANKTECHNAV